MILFLRKRKIVCKNIRKRDEKRNVGGIGKEIRKGGDDLKIEGKSVKSLESVKSLDLIFVKRNCGFIKKFGSSFVKRMLYIFMLIVFCSVGND